MSDKYLKWALANSQKFGDGLEWPFAKKIIINNMWSNKYTNFTIDESSHEGQNHWERPASTQKWRWHILQNEFQQMFTMRRNTQKFGGDSERHF